jgi:hypothetical protein
VYRVSYATDPAKLPDWQYVGSGRFDDPFSDYRVLYLSASRIGAFMEKFQGFRPNNEMLEFEAEFGWSRSDGTEDAFDSVRARELPSGTLEFSEYASLYIGTYATDSDASLLDLTHDASARELSVLLKRNLTVGQIIGDEPKHYPISRRVSRIGWERDFVGILSASALRPTEVINVSLYEGEPDLLRTALRPMRVEGLSADDFDFCLACEYLGITIQTP